jgi:DNA-binding NtrC family response regulator
MSDTPESRKLRVFVVDDEHMIASTLATILTNAGYLAEAFLDPLEALRAAETVCPDIVITDVMMPQLNGIDLGIQFKTKYPACRVLLFAGHGATGEQLKSARDRGHDFEMLAKPMHPKDLLEAIRKTPLSAQG